MDAVESSYLDTINSNHFPAKLWRLINNPADESISWDSQGEVVVINRNLLVSQILSPRNVFKDDVDTFKTTKYSSFVRQLNLYGFRKAAPVGEDHSPNEKGSTFYYFSNPYFKRDKPKLLTRLRRLTVENRAKMKAGLDVTVRPPKGYKKFSNDFDGSPSSPFSPSPWIATPPYLPNKARAMMGHKGTPVPSSYLISGCGAALSPTDFASDRRMPLSFYHHNVASCSTAVQCQQGLLAARSHGNHNFADFTAPNPHLPSYFSPVYQCCSPELMGAHMRGDGLYGGSFSSHTYYPIADKVMQTPSNSSLVHTCAGSIIMAVPGSVQLYESVVSGSEQVPEDAKAEVSSNDAKEGDVKGQEDDESVWNISQVSVTSSTDSEPALLAL